MSDKEEDYKDIEIPAEEEIKPPEGYTVEEWKGLSQGEREVVLDEIANPEGQPSKDETDAVLKEIAGEDDEAKKKAEEDATAQTALEAKAKEEAEAAAKAKETPAPEGDKPMTDEELIAFNFVVETKIDPEEKIPVPDDIQAKLDELEEKFEAGEIERREYNTQIQEINRQATARYMQAKEAEKGDLLWAKEQGLFLRNRTEYMGEKQEDGTYKATLESNMIWGALGKAVENIQAKNPNLSGMQILIEADKVVKKMFAPKEPAPAAKEEPAPEKKTEKPPAKMPEEFVDLGALPAAGKNSTEGSFAQLDKLTGKALENFMQKHPELVDRFIDDLR